MQADITATHLAAFRLAPRDRTTAGDTLSHLRGSPLPALGRWVWLCACLRSSRGAAPNVR